MVHACMFYKILFNFCRFKLDYKNKIVFAINVVLVYNAIRLT